MTPIRYIAADFETSGTSPLRNAPVSFGVCLFEGASWDQVQCVSKERWLFSPILTGIRPRIYEPKAEAIHGLSIEKLRAEGVDVKDVLLCVRTWAKRYDAVSLPIVAHNAPFDYGFYHECLLLAGQRSHIDDVFRRHPAPLLGGWHCTQMLAESVFRLRGYRLDDLRRKYRIDIARDRHDCTVDAEICGFVLAQMAPVLKERGHLSVAFGGND